MSGNLPDDVTHADIEPDAQCDACGDVRPESEMKLEEVPGAVLAWCPECTAPSKAEMYGVRP